MEILKPLRSGPVCHGRLSCRVCWKEDDGGHKFLDNGQAQLVYDPGYWGAADPRILVLGMSKGFTQSNMMAGSPGDFDRVAYAKFRPRLLQSLKAIGLMDDVVDISPKLTAAETDYGFASVVRCSMTSITGGKATSSSNKLIAALKRPEAAQVFENCVRTYVGGLSKRTRLVVLLGNSEEYIAYMNEKMPTLYPDFQAAPGYEGLLYRAGGRFFVHTAHPSGSNGTFTEFLSGTTQSNQGLKRHLAKRAVINVLAAMMPEAGSLNGPKS